MKPSSSPADGAAGLFGPMAARGGAADATSDEGWLRALLDVEAALVAACADAELVPRDAADRIAAACADPGVYDVDAIGAAAVSSASVVVPLVRAIEERSGDAGAFVHLGATSQDVVDTAMMLVARRAIEAIVVDLTSAAEACWTSAADHAATAMAGRTMLQPAVTTTFGLVAAGWASELDGAADRLTAVSAGLPVQLGGAVGTLAGYDGQGDRVRAALAERLELSDTHLAWHTSRLPVADLAGALTTAAGAAGKVAFDVVLLAQAEVGEVSDGVAGRGGSSTMPAKANPVAAVLARAAATRAPGLGATLNAAMLQEHQRAAGTWQAEWPTMTDLLRVTGSAAAWLRDCLENLRVDVERMTENHRRVHEGGLAQSVAGALAPELGREAAHALVADAARTAAEIHAPLFDVLAANGEVRAALTDARLDALAHSAGDIAPAVAAVRAAIAARAARTTSGPR